MVSIDYEDFEIDQNAVKYFINKKNIYISYFVFSSIVHRKMDKNKLVNRHKDSLIFSIKRGKFPTFQQHNHGLEIYFDKRTVIDICDEFAYLILGNKKDADHTDLVVTNNSNADQSIYFTQYYGEELFEKHYVSKEDFLKAHGGWETEN